VLLVNDRERFLLFDRNPPQVELHHQRIS
jgi:hypothetical protein